MTEVAVPAKTRIGNENVRKETHARLIPVAHMPGLDGLRGVAILSVIIFHVLNTAPHSSLLENVITHTANIGWVGVDLFFVLSGFLITGILIDERSSQRYFRTFFSRRALRIVPVYAVFLLFNLWLAP
jgi:peptidoglycan/LPS O-acetylase OafA/YrhL